MSKLNSTYPTPSQNDIVALMERASWTRKHLAAVTKVSITTVDQWLAKPGSARPASPMPAGLYELAKIVATAGSVTT